MYHMNDKIRSSDLFRTTILELVKLIQAALSLFGMFSLCQDDWNGLLCDLTVDGIQRWVTEIGELHMGVEVFYFSPLIHPFFSSVQPTERVADPIVVCALLTQVSNVRHKLYALGFGNVCPPYPRVTLVSHPPRSSFRRTLFWTLKVSSEPFPPSRTLTSLVPRLPQPS